MYIAETDSTNSQLRLHPEWGTVRTDFQSAGRGQQGNGWESERGKNLLFSTLLTRPAVRPTEQFRISMAVALAMHRAVAPLVPDKELLCIKWPNDLYYQDRKLAGILIENTLSAAGIEQSIIGVGLNVNQQHWLGSAPNPTSLRLISGAENEVQPILDAFLNYLPSLLMSPSLKADYMSVLYRRDGMYGYEEREVSIAPTMNQTVAEAKAVFMAEIADVSDDGRLHLRLADGQQRAYHFKQVRYVL